MIHLFINAIAASAGGGLTYIRNVIPCLAQRDDVHTTVLFSGELRDELPESNNISWVRGEIPSGAASRFVFEQRAVRELVRRSGANVLLSTGNFAIWKSPVPQILLSRNSLYTSHHFDRDLRDRGEYRLWMETHLKGAVAKWSIGVAAATVAPSEAFARELQQWTGKKIVSIHHGFDSHSFHADPSPLPTAIQQHLCSHSSALRLLFVSHYNYYRNFETLFRAIPFIRRQLGSRPLALFLTCKLAPGANPGAYRTDSAAALVRDLQISENAVELGTVPYQSLHLVYRSSDIYVSPAYAETFAHPLIESMSSGLPVIASDIAVHREVCGAAALYFEPFSPEQLAERVVELARAPRLMDQLSKAGVERSQEFSWRNHVERILILAKSLVAESKTADGTSTGHN